jgi:hypothetical protein
MDVTVENIDEDLNPDELAKRLQSATGAHKPNGASRANDRGERASAVCHGARPAPPARAHEGTCVVRVREGSPWRARARALQGPPATCPRVLPAASLRELTNGHGPCRRAPLFCCCAGYEFEKDDITDADYYCDIKK